jgi:hypothetical protein
MTAALLERRERLMPGGIPKWVRCYDNEGRSCDRYTAVFSGKAARCEGDPGQPHQYSYLAMSANPCHPQGFGLHGHSDHSACDTPKGAWPPAVGRKNHLGTRINFADLPKDCQDLVVQYYVALWSL